MVFDRQHLRKEIPLFEVRLLTKNFHFHFVFSSQDSKSDTSLRCPLRQTLPIFKQPVTYYPKQRDEVKPQAINSTNTSGGKPSEKTKPRQLFWEKRFENVRPTDIDGQPFEHFQLPEPIQSKYS
jgi:methyl-CpG-binding domain protein 2